MVIFIRSISGLQALHVCMCVAHVEMSDEAPHPRLWGIKWNEITVVGWRAGQQLWQLPGCYHMSAGRHIKHSVWEHLPCGEESVPGFRWAQQILPHVIVWAVHEQSWPWWHQSAGYCCSLSRHRCWWKGKSLSCFGSHCCVHIWLTGNVFSLLNQIWTMCVVSGKSPILMLDTQSIRHPSNTAMHPWVGGVRTKWKLLWNCVWVLIVKFWQTSAFNLAHLQMFQARA